MTKGAEGLQEPSHETEKRATTDNIEGAHNKRTLKDGHPSRLSSAKLNCLDWTLAACYGESYQMQSAQLERLLKKQ